MKFLQILSIIILILLATSFTIELASGSKIVFYFARSTYSHRITVWPLAESLAARGHNVTFVQAYPPKKPNPKIHEFYPKSLLGRDDMDQMNFFQVRLQGGREAIISKSRNNPSKGLELCSKFLTDPETKEWIKSSQFHLIVIDDLHNECGYALAHQFGAKTVLFVTSHPTVRRFEPLGILLETSWIPDLRLSPQVPMNFWERVQNTIMPVIEYFERQYVYYPKLDGIFRESLGTSDVPSIGDLERNTSLVLANTHFSEEFARSLPPMYVPVGGMHCEDLSQTLTPELEKFINDSNNGFIYISFGSAAKISEAPEYFQDIFYQAMTSSQMNFVWKYEGERHAKIPPNVFTANWLPQQAILAHPKIKAYFTHGGLLGIQEAVWHGVPLLAMPVFAEQDYNSLRVHRTKRGIMLDPNTLTLPGLEQALKDVVEDPTYKNNMVQLSLKFKDRPAKPVDTAVWWIEYILRHEDHSDLKPLGMEQDWFVRRSLDVWSLVFTVVAISMIFFVLMITQLVNFIFSRDASKFKVD